MLWHIFCHTSQLCGCFLSIERLLTDAEAAAWSGELAWLGGLGWGGGGECWLPTLGESTVAAESESTDDI